jgi:hypothetical protein
MDPDAFASARGRSPDHPGLVENKWIFYQDFAAQTRGKMKKSIWASGLAI